MLAGQWGRTSSEVVFSVLRVSPSLGSLHRIQAAARSLLSWTMTSFRSTIMTCDNPKLISNFQLTKELTDGNYTFRCLPAWNNMPPKSAENLSELQMLPFPNSLASVPCKPTQNTKKKCPTTSLSLPHRFLKKLLKSFTKTSHIRPRNKVYAFCEHVHLHNWTVFFPDHWPTIEKKQQHWVGKHFHHCGPCSFKNITA